MRTTYATRYLLGCALGVIVLALSIAAPAYASSPMIIEATQAAELAPGSIPAGSLLMSDARPFSTGVEHYTRTVGCGWRRFHYVAKCLSLEQSPPPRGSVAVYDPEKWGLTSVSEHDDWCGGIRLAASLARAAGARLMVSVPEMRLRANVECAARSSRTVIFQIQPHEADPATYLYLLRQATRWARSVRPSVSVVPVLSTNPKYAATVDEMTTDHVEAEAYLGSSSAGWWLNVLPIQGIYTQAVSTATQLLGGIS